MLAIASTLRLCDSHGLRGPVACELKPIARRKLGFVVACQVYKNSGIASTTPLRSKMKLSVYGARYLPGGLTQKMTLPKSSP